MGHTHRLSVIVVLGIAAPAKPCSELLIALDPVPLLQDGSTVPTNVVVVGVPQVTPSVLVTPDGGEAEERTVDEAGRLFLAPETGYTITVGNVSAHVVTGPGPDDTPPPRPEVLGTQVEHVDDHWSFSICDAFPVQHIPGGDRVVVDVDLGDEGIAAVRVGEDGGTIAVSPDGRVSVGDNGIGRVAIIDAAGNRSDVVEIDIDAVLAENAGGCAQTSPSSTSLLALAGLWALRRRRAG
jgi:MYXO-CTERM domain-containing protein